MATAPYTGALAQAHLEALMRMQGVCPVDDPTRLLGTFWPEDETADNFLAAVRAWRDEDEPSESRLRSGPVLGI
jgi:hypothetical protein